MKISLLRAPKYLRYLFTSSLLIILLYIIFHNGIKALVVSLPTLFHVQFFAFLGIWLWGINVYALENAGIDCTSLLAIESKPLTSSANAFISYKNIFSLAEWYTYFYSTSIVVFYYSAQVWEKKYTQWIAVVSTVVAVMILFMPFKSVYKKERNKFVSAIKRIIKPTLNVETSFCDVVLADLITSFSKVVGDFYIAFAEIVLIYLISPIVENRMTNNMKNGQVPFDSNIDIITSDDFEIQKKNVIHFQHHIFLDALGSFMILLPYLFRLKQCVADVRTKATKAQRKKSFFNALKYASSIPVYFFSGYYSWVKSDIKNSNADKTEILEMINKAEWAFFYWIIFSAINSAYSYFWDVFMDWDLGKRSSKNDNSFPKFLRPVLFFSGRWKYYAVIIIDCILRFTWLVDVLSIFGIRNNFMVDDKPSLTDEELQYQIEKMLLSRLLLRLLEILRRWLWIFFRLEREWVYTNGEYIKIEDNRNYKAINTSDIPIVVHQIDL